jgi:NitT/TauT family transport system substrate-binding protein
MKIVPWFGPVIVLLVFGVTAQQAAAQDKIRVAIPLFPTAAFPLLVASDRGFFQKEGLIVEPIRINSAPTTYQALISGDVHAAVGAPTGLLPSHAQGADVISVGSWDNLVPYVWITREKITDIRELRGKKVGVNRAGSKPWLIIHVLLQDAGLDPAKDLTLLQMGGGSQERVAALMRGGIDATLADVLLEPIMKKRGFFVLRGRATPFMNAPIAVKRSYLAGQRSTLKKFVKAFADATRYLVDNREGTLRPLNQLLNSNDAEVVDFAYQYLHANSEATLYPPDDAVNNLIRMSAYMDKKLGAISANRVVDLSILDELGSKKTSAARDSDGPPTTQLPGPTLQVQARFECHAGLVNCRTERLRLATRKLKTCGSIPGASGRHSPKHRVPARNRSGIILARRNWSPTSAASSSGLGA